MVDELLEPISREKPAGEELSGNAEWNVLQRLRRAARLWLHDAALVHSRRH